MILQPARISSNNFSYKNKVFVAEVTALPESFGFGRVYDDAVDIGFTIVSAKTGKPAVFSLSKTEMVDEDVAGWFFKCVTPGFTDLRALIVND